MHTLYRVKYRGYHFLCAKIDIINKIFTTKSESSNCTKSIYVNLKNQRLCKIFEVIAER